MEETTQIPETKAPTQRGKKKDMYAGGVINKKIRKKRIPRKVETVGDKQGKILDLIDEIVELTRTGAKVSWE